MKDCEEDCCKYVCEIETDTLSILYKPRCSIWHGGNKLKAKQRKCFITI